MMKDIPLFTTEYGAASLMLREIPYRGQAYVRVQTVVPGCLKELLAECVAFCRMAGAEFVLAAGEAELSGYPIYTTVLSMRGEAWVDRDKIENLFPVTDATVSRWREIYNERMKGVDCAATLTCFDEKEILSSGGAYFVHRAGELLGIGWLRQQRLLAVCSAKPGAGERIMHTLMSLVEGSAMDLEVASTNQRAIRLYEKLGFLATGEKEKWYAVFPEK